MKPLAAANPTRLQREAITAFPNPALVASRRLGPDQHRLARVGAAASGSPGPAQRRQSVKTSDQACASGIDMHKQIEGVKRHVLMDTLGLLLGVVVTAASVQDRDGAKTVVARCGPGLIRLAHLWTDASYAGALVAWVQNFQPERSLTFEIARRTQGQKGLAVLPRRWVVERTPAWLVKRRHLARHDEQRPDHSDGRVLRLRQVDHAWVCPAP